MTRFVAIHGTWGWPDDPTSEWWYPGSPWLAYMGDHDCTPARDEPFVWSGDVGGTPRSGRDWDAGAHALKYYLRPLPYEQRNVVAHSHGGQIALLCAQQGVALRSLLLIGTPVRRDIEQRVVPAALPHIGVCRHIIDARWDRMGWLGGAFDGRLSTRRGFRVPGITVELVPHIGHSGILRDPALFHLWDDQGWIDLLRGAWSDGPPAA